MVSEWRGTQNRVSYGALPMKCKISARFFTELASFHPSVGDDIMHILG